MSNTERRAAPLSAEDAARLRVSDKPGKITCRANGSTATMLLYGEVGWEVTARGVTEALAAAPKADTLDIRISSIGGSVTDGWAIYNAISRHPATTKTVTVEGLAASMASVIAMAGTEIVIPENSYMMIHNPSGVCFGGADDMRGMADLMEHMQGVAARTYADRSGQPVPVVQAMMNAETYMSAEQAHALGFADRVERPVSVTAQLDLSKLPTLPAQMRAALTKEFRMSDKPADKPAPAPVPTPAPAPLTNPPPQPVPAAPPPVQPTDQPAPLGHPFPGQDIGGRPATDAPAHTGDGEPGALPVDAPDTRRPTPPASPGYLPADPVHVAEACAHAGFATMTARMLRGRYSAADVQQHIEQAQQIQEAGQKTGQAALAMVAIEEGLSVDAFRKLAFAAKSGSEASISTAVPPKSAAQQAQVAALNPAEIFANQRRQMAEHAKRAGH